MVLCSAFVSKLKSLDKEDMQVLVASLFLRTPVLFSLLIPMVVLKDGISLNKDHNLKMLQVILNRSKMYTHFA